MFKWKVSRLGSSKKERNSSKQQQRLNNATGDQEEEIYAKNVNNNNKERLKDVQNSPSSKRFGLFQAGSPRVVDTHTMSRVGQRLAMTATSEGGLALSNENLLSDGSMPPPLPPLKPGWRQLSSSSSGNNNGIRLHNGQRLEDEEKYDNDDHNKEEEEEAIPSDSLYGSRHQHNGPKSIAPEFRFNTAGGRGVQNGGRPFPVGGELAHWSSHGYLAKDSPDSCGNSHRLRESPSASGYVLLRRQGDVTGAGGAVQQQQQRSRLPPPPLQQATVANGSIALSRFGSNDTSGDISPPAPTFGGAASGSKYFSVKGLKHLGQMHQDSSNENGGGDNRESFKGDSSKYFSVDSSFLGGHSDLRARLRQANNGGGGSGGGEIHQFNTRQPAPSSADNSLDLFKSHSPLQPPSSMEYQQPPSLPPYQRPPPPPPPTKPIATAVTETNNSLANSKNISGSVSWLEWTQQLQAYVAWVNSQLRKRPGVRPVNDLRTDLQSGEILAQLIEIISGEEIAGIEYGPESLQGMRENLERVLQFMAHKRIRMHSITSKELLEGNLKSVMRLILALAAHYKPQSVKHHNMSGDNLPGVGGGSKSDTIAADPQPSAGRLAGGGSSQPESRSGSQLSTAETSWRTKSGHIGEPGENPRRWKKPGAMANGGSADSPRQSVETQTALSAAANAVASAASSAEVTPRSIGPSPVCSVRGLKDESFSRSGSGRKLPQIPPGLTGTAAAVGEVVAATAANRVRCNTLPSRRPGDEEEETEDKEKETSTGHSNSKSSNKPKALEFWESMENIERSDFRYNTIHRMSVGRRQLPKPPGGGDPTGHHHHQRSQSIDQTGSEVSHQPCSLNSSFSGPSSLPIHSAPHSPRLPMKKMPPDGASLQSTSSGSTSQEEAEVVSRRGEVEGSSDKNSPPTSLVQGVAGSSAYHGSIGAADQPNPAYEWVRGSFDQSGQRKKWGLPSPIFLAAASKGSNGGGVGGGVIETGHETGAGDKAVPYTVLLQELMQAKKQLQELYQLDLHLDLDSLQRPPPLRRREDKQPEVKQRTSEARGLRPRDYAEEMQIVREAIASLRSLFRDTDPGHHILDTLEQCIAVIVEKAGGSEEQDGEQNGTEGDITPPPANTKIIYFMPRSATPFMTSVNKPLGRITLRDFKTVFDRPGFYRYHIKNTDTEYGMVKEEIIEDDKILPGTSGKIVIWVEEE